MRIAMSVRVYYSLDHLFHQHGCVAHRNENCNVCMCIVFPSTPISLNMEWVAHINEICNVCMCILFPWSPIFPTWMGLLTKFRIALSVCVYYSLGFSPSMEGDFQRNENCTVCTCILFPWSPISPTWMCSSQKWELQCLYVYIIPLITYFTNMVV